MSNEDSTISEKNWVRSVQYINKIGYMDGADNGQTASFQWSFDTGYKQGLSFGIKLGFQDAMTSNQDQLQHLRNQFIDPRRINCQLCTNQNKEEKNNEHKFD